MHDNTGKGKLIVHLIVPLLLSMMALAGALLRVYSFNVNDYDYAIFSNLFWNFAHDNGWRVSLYEGQARVLFLADHLDLLFPLLAAPFYILFPSPYTYSVLHSLAFTAVFFLVPIFVREVWKQDGREDYLPAALFLLLALSLFRGFCTAWAFQATTTLAMPFLLASLIALHRKKLAWVVLFCLLMALTQERASVAVFGVGMYALFITKNYRLGLALCAFSAVYFFTAVKLVIPFFSGQGYMYSSNIQPLHDLDKKAWFLFRFFALWFFLPLLSKRALWAVCCALPLLGLALVSNRLGMYSFQHHYQDLQSIFFLAASTFGLLRLSEARWFRRLPRSVLALLACACLIFAYHNSKSYVPARLLVKWSPKPEIIQLNTELSTYSRLAPDIRVYASSGIGPRFSMRKHRYVLTPEVAARHLSSSMVFVALKQDMYPFKEQADTIVSLLLSNPSLKLIKHKPELELLVFASTDLLNEPTAIHK